MAKIENVNLTQDDFKLDIPAWEFSDSKISAVWGRSGSGKTTLLWLMAGLYEAPGFSLIVDGQDLAKEPSNKRHVGFVFQDFSLFPHMTVRENILFPAKAQGISPKIWDGPYENLVERLELNKSAEKKCAVLSGGEAQRVSLARALLLKPKLMLLDEPFSSLDEINKGEARELIKELNIEFKIPFVLVTHDTRDVRALSECMLVLENGKSVAQGQTEAVLKSLAL